MPLVYFFASWGVLAVAGPPIASLIEHHALEVVLVAFGVMFLVPLPALLWYIFTLPSHRGRGN